MIAKKKARDIGIVSYFVSRNYQNAETFKSIGNSDVVTAIIGPRQRISVCITVMKRLHR